MFQLFLSRRMAATLVFVFLLLNIQAGTLPSGFAELRLAEGLDGTTVNYAPDGRLFVTQKKGVINIIKNGTMLTIPFLDIQSNVDNRNERGLQSLVFDPDFATNGYIYVYYCRAGEARNRVSRFTANGDVAVANSETVIVNLDVLPGSIHNGGAMFFKGGKLFITTGDGSNGNNAASFNSLLGKVLRVNKDGTIPSDNPFYTSLTGAYRMIYALGFRNPFRAAVQPGTEKVFINDVGGALFEEINELFPGKNYGWPSIEGKRTTQTAPTNYQDPLYAYSHSLGCSIGGGAFYNPQTATFPSKYVGKYFFGDYCGNYIKVLDPATGQVIETFATNVNRPISFSVGNNGNFYYLARGGLAGGSSEANTQSCCSEVWQIRFTNSGVPTISAHPSSQTVSIGGTAVFAVGASGDAPLSYQWQRNGVNIPNATTFRYEISNATLNDNGAVYRAVITNPLGTATTDGAVLTVTSNLPPEPVISSPSAGFKYTAGTTLNFSGSATDAEDGQIPASALTWEINFHHGTHTHPGLPPTSGITGGTFSLSENHDPASDVWYRIYLTARDSQGQERTVYRDVHPVLSDVVLATNRPGLNLSIDGTVVAAPYAFTGVAGIHRQISAPAQQVVGGVTYTFIGWSDGGAREHEITTPSTNQTITAYYLPLHLEAEVASFSGGTLRWGYAGFSGTGYIDFDLASDAYIEWVVNVPVAGDYVLDFRYGNGTVKDRPLQLKVNNIIRESSLSFPSTGVWTTWGNIKTTQPLNAGNNTVRITTIGSNGGNYDYLQVYQSNAPVPVVATPVFSPAPGTYTAAQNVSISSATSGASIYYTTNGSTPTTSSTLYTSPVTISGTTTLKAIAVKSGMSNSSVQTGNYTINTGEPDPGFSQLLEAELATLYNTSVKKNYLGFTGTGFSDFDAVSGAYVQWAVNVPSAGSYTLEFRYANGASSDRPLSIAINGSIVEARKSFPSTGAWTNWAKVTSAVQLNAGTNTIRASTIGLNGGNLDHLVVLSAGPTTPVVSNPVFSPGAGNYTSPVAVTISTGTPNAVIYYTTNGSNPTTSSSLYSAPLNVSTNTTLKAMAVRDGYNPSSIVSASYTFSAQNPVFDATLEAENATLSGALIKFGYSGWTGTGYGDYMNASNDYIHWNVNVPAAGTYNLQFRYALPTGNRPLRLDVNGSTSEASLAFPFTGAWTTWAYVTKAVSLNAGNNTVRLTATGFSGANLDHLRVTNDPNVVASGVTDVIIPPAEFTELDEHDNELINAVEVYPIPVRDILTIQSSAALDLIRMYDITGNTVNPRVHRKSDNELEIDVTGVKPGMCILLLKTGTQLVSKKVLISE